MNDAVLVQHGVGQCAEMIRVTAPYHRRYCAFHGVDYHADFGQRRRIGESLFMEKIVLLLNVLKDYDLGTIVAWLDADTLIVNPAINLRDGLPQPCNLALLRQPDGVFNTGVMLIRADPVTIRFFEAIQSLGGISYKNTHHDEGRVNWLLDNVLPTTTGICVKDLPDAWNLWSINKDKQDVGAPFIRAWHGENHLRTRNRMIQLTQTMEAAPHA